uniref:fimbrial biogenesis chaperone n=1 Tax=Microbulbifer agarilyticus TaxID=260552 RepID=UPI000255AA5E|nr:fimbria/pilus periplasmic chaperone [Microbulbifer agarilyticus]
MRRLLAALLSSAILLPSLVHGQSVSPTRLDLDLREGNEAVLTLTATHPAAQALELSVRPYRTAQDAEKAQTPFSVSPPQLLLQPGDTRQVRVRWHGTQQPQQSQSYYLVIEELNLRTRDSDDAGQINLLTTFKMPLHVFHGGEATLVATPGESPATIQLSNTGARFARLSHYRLEAENTSTDGITIARLLNRDALLPGETVSLPVADLGLPTSQLSSLRIAHARKGEE